ncbi:S49 family peptidase [Pseudoruegeria sp. HB172150]|uniref:S49 family peptidase n=1 Tax=Pseudoruegeria sp. HB172150 TaxID=2721164 RepID=UPI001556CEC1|nr:S49 family peptidase [Pseudoruegeria sp. HB172150]
MRNWFPFLNSGPKVAVVRLTGMIASGNRGNALNDAGLAPMIERAFRKGKPDAVALVINSPGGSPVQSSLIAARIRRLAAEKNVKVYAFTEDVAASGGYWLACAADEIWIDPSSIVGSIGVVYSGFGFQDLIARYGVERRVHTAGKSKSMLDPFREEKPEDIEKLKGWQDQIHDSFIDYVKDRRGARLADEPDLFTGNVWIGEKAVDVGLADGVGHLVPKMKDVFGEKVRFIPYAKKKGLFSRLSGQVADNALGVMEERGLFARFGL